jgi:hypothetical protein
MSRGRDKGVHTRDMERDDMDMVKVEVKVACKYARYRAVWAYFGAAVVFFCAPTIVDVSDRLVMCSGARDELVCRESERKLRGRVTELNRALYISQTIITDTMKHMTYVYITFRGYKLAMRVKTGKIALRCHFQEEFKFFVAQHSFWFTILKFTKYMICR